jgi:hypothetical protein
MSRGGTINVPIHDGTQKNRPEQPRVSFILSMSLFVHAVVSVAIQSSTRLLLAGVSEESREARFDRSKCEWQFVIL